MRIIKGEIKTTTKGKVKTERKIPQHKTKYDEKRQHTTSQHNRTHHEDSKTPSGKEMVHQEKKWR